MKLDQNLIFFFMQTDKQEHRLYCVTKELNSK